MLTPYEDTAIKMTHYRCPSHGIQPTIGIQFSIRVGSLARPDISEAIKQGIERSYCVECMIAMFDKFCEQVTPLPDAEHGEIAKAEGR